MENNDDFPEIYTDTIPVKTKYKVFANNEVEIKRSYPDVIIGVKVNNLKSSNGNSDYGNPLLKNDITIKLSPTLLYDMNYEIKIYLMKYPE